VHRLDLMNERGFLADDWRAIKLAADDLKSVLNLNASQSIRTEENRATDFTFRNSTTRVNLALDLPVNRRAQRNGYRRTLIGYNAGQRSLINVEDNIKFEIRNGLRQLDLDRVQYEIDVASAALAGQRVVSTRLELIFGLSSVTPRDFLEAQDDYQAGLSAVARGRIQYIQNRAQLALDLEIMMLDDAGFWREISDEEYQPRANVLPSPLAGPAYGDIPKFLKISKRMKRMLHIPPAGWPEGEVIVEQPTDPSDTRLEPPIPEPLPFPIPVPE